MLVKIGDKLYGCENEPIMLILDDFDKYYITHMGEQTKYCRAPAEMNGEDVNKFMEVK